MASEGRLEGSPVEQTAGHSVAQPELEAALEENPRSFGFFQAVRLLEGLLPDRAPVGGFGDPADEVARFSVAPFISFPSSEIQELELSDGEPVDMSVNFMGLTGPLGVLPFYYTQEVAKRRAKRDHAIKDFFDIFHHRFVSLFYRAWEKTRFAAGYGKDRRDRVTEHLYDLIGVGLPSHRNRLPVSDEALVFYTGLLAPHQRSAVGLEQMLEDFFNVPVEVEQFVGGWYALAIGTQCSVGEPDASAQLGLGASGSDL
jgi:type VI secretion system protein ImpH